MLKKFAVALIISGLSLVGIASPAMANDPLIPDICVTIPNNPLCDGDGVEVDDNGILGVVLCHSGVQTKFVFNLDDNDDTEGFSVGLSGHGALVLNDSTNDLIFTPATEHTTDFLINVAVVSDSGDSGTILLNSNGSCPPVVVPGPAGPSGPPGTPGTPGQTGPSGANGANGEDGSDGAPGTQGPGGLNGVEGLPGTNGINGVNGKDGANGTDGKDGGAVTTVTVTENAPAGPAPTALPRTGTSSSLTAFAAFAILLGGLMTITSRLVRKDAAV